MVSRVPPCRIPSPPSSAPSSGSIRRRRADPPRSSERRGTLVSLSSGISDHVRVGKAMAEDHRGPVRVAITVECERSAIAQRHCLGQRFLPFLINRGIALETYWDGFASGSRDSQPSEVALDFPSNHNVETSYLTRHGVGVETIDSLPRSELPPRWVCSRGSSATMTASAVVAKRHWLAANCYPQSIVLTAFNFRFRSTH